MTNELIPWGLVALAGALGWFGRRWITGAKHKEEADSLASTVDLMERLSRLGVSVDDAREFRERLRAGEEPITPIVATAISEQEDADFCVLDQADTTVGMVESISLRLSHLETDLEHAVEALLNSVSQNRAAALMDAHRAWLEYRDKEAWFARLLFEGGTAAPLLGGSRKIELTEDRIRELRQIKAEEDKL